MDRKIRRVGPIILSLMAVALLSAACGDDAKGPTVPQAQKPSDSAQKSAAPGEATMLGYSKCMRENGVPKFPDPGANGQVDIVAGKDGMDPNSAAFKSAQEACRALLPGGSSEQQGKDKAAALKYAACMRSHGVPKFPDPDSQGGLQMNGNDIGDPNAPAFKAALQACQNLQPGGPEAERNSVTN